MSSPAPAVHTVLSVLRATEAWLQQRAVDAPRRSAELLLGKVLGLDRMQLYLAHDRPLDPSERAAMRALVARRGRHEPVAHLLGEWSFRGLPLEVGPAVLIPRPETEDLVDLALQKLPPQARVLDLGTGSGAIAIALALARADVQVVATDISKNALAVAQRNVARHGLADRVRLACGSWWQAEVGEQPFALVVSNPPYIDPEAEPRQLDREVAAFEPPLALFTAAHQPASCYQAIFAELAAHLLPGGWFVGETGASAAGPALQLLAAEPLLQGAELRPDFAGLPRYLLAQRRG
ncbi:MAG TPA: peptide chain release factor N(5)-glutamine methyltransferase [Planctomycetota bacterium]|nr:peptide chain release factor N(5)-glutamine methyltransferase [Planctomycetota bacterium]